MSVLEAVLGEASVYSVSRPAAGTWSAGIYTPGALATVSVTMVVQPLSAREAQYLPEGIRTKQLLRCHATTELKAPERSTSTLGDRFTYLGEVFEVVQVANRLTDGGYCRAVAARVGG